MKTINFKTRLGDIKAIDDDGTLFFKGLPYAKTARFKSPILITDLNNFDATKIEKDCFQEKAFKKSSGNSFYDKEFDSHKEYEYNEDYVCLNIITKHTDKKLPVLVFIHGGSFEIGSVNDIPYGESKEYIKRDVILVNISYRLNIFGFYRNRNYGLEDMAMAIEWIHQYIEDFNGDNSKVTIMGQSAGAMSIVDLLYTPLLKDKISGAIIVSGTGSIPSIVGPYTYKQSKTYWDNFLKENNLNSDDDLLKLSAKDLWLAWYKYTKKNYNLRIVQPGIDGKIIYDSPTKMLKADKVLDVPLIVGVTAQDFLGPLLFGMTKSYALYFDKHKQSKVYPYFFDRTLPGNSYKAFHCADLWYLFGCLDKCWRPFKEDDYKLKDLMIDYVSNFVRSGNPNGEGLDKWLPFNKKGQEFRLFKDHTYKTIKPLKAYLKTAYYYVFEKGPL